MVVPSDLLSSKGAAVSGDLWHSGRAIVICSVDLFASVLWQQDFGLQYCVILFNCSKLIKHKLLIICLRIQIIALDMNTRSCYV